jgi:hypothetical protein
MMKAIFAVCLLAGMTATATFAQDYGRQEEKERSSRASDAPAGIIQDTEGALEGRSVESDGDCRVVVERYRDANGDIVEERHRECD